MDETKNGYLLALIIIVLVTISLLLTCSYFPAETDAKLYNKKFQTSYTIFDFLWARETIKKFHEEKISERPKPYEVNANLKIDT